MPCARRSARSAAAQSAWSRLVEAGEGFVRFAVSAQRRWVLFLAAAAVAVAAAGQSASGQVQHVFHISVDGLRPDAVTTLGASQAPNLYRFRTEGAFTDNAR